MVYRGATPSHPTEAAVVVVDEGVYAGLVTLDRLSELPQGPGHRGPMHRTCCRKNIGSGTLYVTHPNSPGTRCSPETAVTASEPYFYRHAVVMSSSSDHVHLCNRDCVNSAEGVGMLRSGLLSDWLAQSAAADLMEGAAVLLLLWANMLVGETQGSVYESDRNLLQFREMIKCVLPNSSPLDDFADYGCYCGLGGQGTPVDQLDQCCFVHDGCYSKAQNLSSCDSILDSPYVNTYDFRCDSSTNTVTCLSSNNACDMFICECDRVASACFGVTPYNASNNHLSSSLCKSASGVTGSSTLTTVSLALILVLKLTSMAR
ncbi:hypothetical protein NFI96_025921 [Prochilodus magdalenae]|nr:hypothetical protein NFI96_025921 [Prochilodus magdalenae]